MKKLPVTPTKGEKIWSLVYLALEYLVLPSVLVFGNKLIEKTRFKLNLLSGGEHEVMKIGEAETAEAAAQDAATGETEGGCEHA